MHKIKFEEGAINPTDCIKLGWKTLRNRFWLLLGICMFLASSLGLVIQWISPLPALLTQVISIAISGSLSAGIFYIVLTEIDGKRADISMLSAGLRSFTPAAAIALIGAVPNLILKSAVDPNSFIHNRLEATELVSVAVTLGVFTIAVGIVISFLLYFAYPLIAEYELGAIETVKLSAAAAAKNVQGIFLLGILNFLIIFAAMIVGLLLIIGIGAGTMALGAKANLLMLIPFWVVLNVAISLGYTSSAHAYRQVFPKTSGSVI